MIIPLDHIDQGLKLEIKGDSDNSTIVIAEDQALHNASSQYQIMEGCSYEYQLSSKNFGLINRPPVITVSKFDFHKGYLKPNIYVGTLPLEIVSRTDHEKTFEPVYIEVLATKLGDSQEPEPDKDYLKNYRSMLNDISGKCAELLMQINSPVSQKFEPDFELENKTIYQRFAFVRSLIGSDDFNDAVNRILYSPSSKWKEIREIDDIRRIRRISYSSVRQIMNSPNRMKYSLTDEITTVPAKILNAHKTETYDTPENRFVKYALATFLKFCDSCERRFEQLKYEKSAKEAKVILQVLQNYLEAPFFREVSQPATLQLNSPLLQRKSGYREILNAWILYSLAAKLIWKGGGNVYHINKRDIAVLYEYWLFFKLYDMFTNKFEFSSVTHDGKPVQNLIDYENIEETKDGLGLKLKSGKETSLTGKTRNQTRELSVRFSYNRTYDGDTRYIEHGDFYRAEEGSWTKSLRPDYTLSLWPSGLKEGEAESEDLIVHIHFDAKYKVKWYELLNKRASETDEKQRNQENTGDESDSEAGVSDENNDSLEKEKREERKGIYKNADLLKMHAYKDAIRRTGGAYVLYPGEGPPEKTNPVFLGFHEIVPGLGAFAIRPESEEANQGIEKLSEFIDKVIIHFQDRANQRERIASKSHSVHKVRKKEYREDGKTPNITSEAIPEYSNAGLRKKLLPDETYVLVGYYKSQEHLNWIMEKFRYNIRTGSARGAMPLSPEIVGADYLLLHSEDDEVSGTLFKVSQSDTYHPQIIAVSDSIFKNYPAPNHKHYLVFSLEMPENEFKGKLWEFKKLNGYSEDKEAFPFTCSLTELLKVTLKQV